MIKDDTQMFVFVGSIIASCIAIVLVVYNVVFSPLNNAIAAEAHARSTGDTRVEEKLDKILQIAGKTNVMLAQVQTTVEINTKRLDRIESKVR